MDALLPIPNARDGWRQIRRHRHRQDIVPDEVNAFVASDSHPHPDHSNGSGFSFTTSIDAAAHRLDDLLPVTLSDRGPQWHTQLLVNPLGLLFVANPTWFDSNPTEVQRAIIESSHSILPLKQPNSSSNSLRCKTTYRPLNSRRSNTGTQIGHKVHLNLRENPPARGGHLDLQGKRGRATTDTQVPHTIAQVCSVPPKRFPSVLTDRFLGNPGTTRELGDEDRDLRRSCVRL